MCVIRPNLRTYRSPKRRPPPTVTSMDDLLVRNLSLDEAIRIALANAEVVRVFTGLSATSGGRTIYDTAIVNNGIDEAHARFDPSFQAQNRFQSQTRRRYLTRDSV